MENGGARHLQPQKIWAETELQQKIIPFPTPISNRDLVGTGNHKHTRSFLLWQQIWYGIEKVRNPRNRFWWDGYTPPKLRDGMEPPKVMEVDSSDDLPDVNFGWCSGGTLAVSFRGSECSTQNLKWMVSFRYTPSLSSWTLLEDWVMIWFPRTVLSESWLHGKKAGPRPPKSGFCLLF